jgi:ABC-2 type transport system ATP-binding protein
VDGINIKDDPMEIKRRLGFIPDNPFLYEKLTAREFLRFIGKIYDLDDKYIAERMKYYLDLFNLTDWGNDLIESFSHGMRQKIAMAAALLHKPSVIIVDEPMVGLDPKGIIQVKNIFSKLATEEKITIFMSTHTLSIAEEICTRIGIIHKGRLIAEGTSSQLQKDVNSKQGNLEDIFMILTDEVSSTELALKQV